MNKIIKVIEDVYFYIIKLIRNRGFSHFYNKGIDYFNKKKYVKAIELFKLAVQQQNVQPQAYYNMALSYQYLKDYERAIATYNKFLELRPDDYDGVFNLALTYYLKENFIKSIELFEKCVVIKKDEEGIKALVLAYLSGNETEKAIEFAEDVFQSSKNGVKFYYAIAKVFENKNSLNKDFTYLDVAIEMYLNIAKFDPENFDSYLSISICYAKKGEWENSVEFCKKALATNPNSFEANNQMGLVYYCCNQVEEAIHYYETALNLKPRGDYKIYSNLAYAYEKFGDYKKAIKIFTQLVNNFPNYPARDEIRNHLRILKTTKH